jgi:glycosyltransferase involved in cell wall biosynthesis
MIKRKKKQKMVVSVLTTAFNASPYIKESIQSILNQKFKNWELILIDNGSTDATAEILEKFKDKRISKIYLKKNIARVNALRLAFLKSRGKYICILDADDIAHPDRLLDQVNYLNQHQDVALVGSYAELINEVGVTFKKFTPPTQNNHLKKIIGWVNPFVHSSIMYRKKEAEKLGGYPKNFIWGHDFALLLRMASIHKISIIGKFLCRARVYSASMSKNTQYQKRIALENLILYKRVPKLIKLDKESKQMNNRAVAIAKMKLALYFLRNESFLKGVSIIFIELIKNPSCIWANGPVRRFLGAKY